MTTIPASNIRMDQPAGPSDTGVGQGQPHQSSTAGATAASTANHSALLDELATFASSLQNIDKAGDQERTTGPNLAAPAKAFSGDEMIALLRTLQEKSQNNQLEGAKKNIETSQIQADQNHAQQLEKIEEWIEKCEKAKKSGIFGKIFGWIGKIAAFVASLVAVVALAAGSVVTGGAATPLLALATIALVSSGMALADQVSQELGGPNISISNALTTIMGKMLQAFGVPEETANKIGKTLAGATALLMPAMLLVEPSMLGDMITGICDLAGVDEKTLGIISMVATVIASVAIAIAMAVISGGTAAGATVAKIAQVAGQITAGVSQVGQGASNIATAKHQADAEKTIADRQKLTALMVELQKNMEDEREEIKKIITEIDEGMQAVSRLINDISDSMSQITHNLRGQGAV